MILSDREIRLEIDAGNIVFDPPVEHVQVGDASVDVRLGQELRVPKFDEQIIIRPRSRMRPDLYGELRTIDAGGFNLTSKEFVLGSTLEKLKLPNYLVGRLEGKSGLARFGLLVHATSAHIDPGFQGVIVLELCNLGPNTIVLEAGMPIGHLVFEKVSIPPSKAYSGQFAHQEHP